MFLGLMLVSGTVVAIFNHFSVHPMKPILSVALLSVATSFLASRWLSSALERLHQGLSQLSNGSRIQPTDSPQSSEFRDLTTSMNRMAETLNERIQTLTRERSLKEMILTSMLEGIVAIDADGKIQTINDSAYRLLGVPPESGVSTVRELFRNSAFHDFVALRQRSDVAGSIDIVTSEQAFRIEGVPLLGHQVRLGTLFVFQDVRQIKHLERVRRDFVANVSHQLKTPITVIKGIVETLVDTPTLRPDQTAPQLTTVLRTADHMHAIIVDLLLLSRLDGVDGVQSEMTFDTCDVHEMMEACLLTVDVLRAPKSISIHWDRTPAPAIRANPTLMRQAICNILENAIRYSPAQSEIRVITAVENAHVTLTFQDQGPGIPRTHMDRIFERFFRANSVEPGTGLGLSIARHIMMIHGGSISVSNVATGGTAFRISIPIQL